MLKIKVHRGTHQIGGSVTEIYTKNTHLFIDFGSELNVEQDKSTDSKMINMIQRAKCDVVLFTHYHYDHVGMIQHIPKKDIDGKLIKLGIGKVAKQILLNIHKTLTQYEDCNDEHKKYIEILNDEKRIINIENKKTIFIGEKRDIKVTPILVDHSAYDAYMFIIEAEGKVIVHTGDFRTHGRLGEGFFERLKNALEDKAVHTLITEGTMMSRLKETVMTEKEMQKKALEILKKPENKYAFLICSSTNPESLTTFANAAMYLKRAFYVNNYVYEQIKTYRNTIGKNNKNFTFWKTYKFENMTKYNPKLKMTQPEYMKDNGFVMLIGAGEAYKKRMEYFNDLNPLLIYSLWSGYVKKGMEAYNEKLGALYHNWDAKRRIDLHTGGHATAKDISKMILTVKPQYIIPIHTEKSENFEKLNIGEYSKKIIKLDDDINKELAMDLKLKEEYQNWADNTIALLNKKKKQWVDIYNTYADEMLSNKDEISEYKSKFHKWEPLKTYLCIDTAKSKRKTKIFDLRYKGQSVGEILVKDNSVKLRVTKTKAKNNEKFFKLNIGEINDDWRSKKAEAFRKFFKTCKELPRQKEHMIESALLSEFEKKTSEKTFPNIQPISYADIRIHMKTSLTASKAKDNIIVQHDNGCGGDIDIFCRRKVGKETRLVVIEVKDENKPSESFDKTMKQAISYAAFIRELIHSEAGSKWLKLWGITEQQRKKIWEKKGFTIDCVVAMPKEAENTKNTTRPGYSGETLEFNNADGTTDYFALHYIAFDKKDLNDKKVKFETSMNKKANKILTVV